MQQKIYRRALPVSKAGALIFFLLFLLRTSTNAQTNTSSPYSRYGLGELQERSFVNQAAMGGIGYALVNDTLSPFYINITNPASYSGIRLTTFDAAVKSTTYNLSSNTTSKILNNTSLAYLSLGFPLGKRGGGAFGLLPYSSVGYNITDSYTNDFNEDVGYRYEGSGGLNQFYMGAALRPFINGPSRFLRSADYLELKNAGNYDKISRIMRQQKALASISLGANGSYVFGSINNVRRVTYTAPNHFNTKVTETTNVGDFTADLGLQFGFLKDSIKVVKRDSLGKRIPPFKKDIEDIKLTFGFTAGLPSSLYAKRSELVQTFEISSLGVEQFKDTVVYVKGKDGSIDIPLSLGGGFTIRKGDRWLMGADYHTQQWSQLTVLGENAGLANSSRISLGAQYVPGNREGSTSYWNRVNYRAGLKYRKTHLELKDTRLNEYSVSLGIGLPLRVVKVGPQYTHSIVNISLEAGQRGTLENSLIREQFFRAMVSFTLNDRWFIPRKFD